MGGSRGRDRYATGLAAVLCLAADPGAPAGPVAGDVSLAYQLGPGAADCPGEEAFRERAADAFGLVDPFLPSGAAGSAHLRVDIERRATTYRATVRVLDPARRDSVALSVEEHDNCDALVWTLGHRMALTLMPRPSPAPVAAVAPAAEPPAAAPVDPRLLRRLDALEEAREDQALIIAALKTKIARLERKQPMDLTYVLSTGAFLTANLTSNVGPGAWLGAELRSGPISLGLELRTVIPAPVEVGPFDFDVSQFGGVLVPCGRYSYFYGCGVFGVAAQLEYDSNFPGGSKSGVDPAIQLGGRLGVEVPFGDTMFGARAWGEVLYNTPGVMINYIGTPYSWSQPDVSAFFGLGVIVMFDKEGT